MHLNLLNMCDPQIVQVLMSCIGKIVTHDIGENTSVRQSLLHCLLILIEVSNKNCCFSLVCGGALVALDSYYYGRLIVTPWEFFRFNVLHDIASFYGQHPW